MANSNSILQVYGGAIVLDPGSQSTKVGYAGEDYPRIITPSYARFDTQTEDAVAAKKNIDADGDIDLENNNNTNDDDNNNNNDNDDDTSFKPNIPKKRSYTYYSENSINFPKPHSEIKPILEDGIISDWDTAVEQWNYLFESLNVDYKQQPLLLTEPVWNTAENRTKSLEIALEQFEFPGFYLASTPTCVSFALGRPSALVVDIGHDITSVTPVVDGMCLTKTTLKTHYGGRYLSTQLQHSLHSVNEDIIPLYKVKSKVLTKQNESPNWVPKQFENITKSFEEYQIENLYKQIKESIIKVPIDPIDHKANYENEDELFPKRPYELPNGHTFEYGKKRFEIGDSLFEPKNYLLDEFPAESGEPEINSKIDYVPLKRAKKPTEEEEEESTKTTGSKRQKKEIPKYRGLGDLTAHALSLVDVDLRAQLAHNIIVTGSSSLIPGLNDRLMSELQKAHPGLKIRIHASGNTAERKFQSWIGGSVLSSLGTFHQLWVSKKEFEEVGAEKLLTERFR
ncbi:Actin-1 [Wickerhamomyces ciferrii]|uniref:Actin-1 n=1 Tax=Wickerhamomyces ciferrii (strain ATCC 14091 / BCRC 22168 / CBS 111 / JCM 3599 / NBRC 0793 / NRRL Y-1031 F-60-10) TaxID=1206466 RepID=K0KRI1_WICCF|nr:Actin-1 [Wickerhamomyces ciferrii]CCH43928.1 Actin-1 [Wickerhamomyces ciferrii]